MKPTIKVKMIFRDTGTYVKLEALGENGFFFLSIGI
jgi:hypothetical protein